MQSDQTSYRNVLSEEFELRVRRNPAYSLRAYARDLGLSHSSLSRILGKEQGLSLTKTVGILKALKLTEAEGVLFQTMVQSECARSKVVRAHALKKIKAGSGKVADLSVEYFKIIADWHHFAIVELTEVEGFQSDAKWISQRLGISEREVKEAVARLMTLELIEKVKGKPFRKTAEFRATHSAVPNRSIQSHHRQILVKAEKALFEQEPGEREFSSISFAMNSESLAWAKEEMKKFRRNLTRHLAKEENKNRLYEFSMQLFALDQLPKKETL